MSLKFETNANGQQDLALAPNKSCGTCSLCCKIYDVPWLDKPKPAGKWCHHCKPGEGGGCAIWATRPTKCADYHCLWRYDHVSSDDWRPDVAGFLMNKQSDQHPMVVIVDPDRPTDWMREPYYSALRRGSEILLQQGQMLMVYVGDEVSILVPQGPIKMPPEARHRQFQLERHTEGNRIRYNIKIGAKVTDVPELASAQGPANAA